MHSPQIKLYYHAFLGALLSLSAFSLHAEDGTGTATATVYIPITVSDSSQDLDFGAFSALTGGTVVIDTAGSRSATGAVVLSAMDTGSQGVFAVAGEPSATYSITLPGSATITHTDTTTTMSVGTFTSNPTPTGTLDGSGDQTLNVGATVTVASSQKPGAYSGTFTVTVEYN